MIRATLQQPRVAHALVVVAGVGVGLFAITTSSAFAQTSRTWTNTESLSTPRAGHTSTLLHNGDLLAVGDEDATGVLASAELCNPSAGTWQPTATMNAKVSLN